MRSILFFLLSVCYVIVSGQKVKVHVKGATGYKTLEFKDKTDGKEQFTLGSSTAGKQVKVSEQGVIGEDALEIGLVAETASILEVPQPEIKLPLSEACDTSVNCIGSTTKAQFTIQAKNLLAEHTKMTCTKKGETTGEFQLDHSAVAAEGKIPVVSGEIKQHVITIDKETEKCTIAKTDGSGPIELKADIPCTDVNNCMQFKATQYVIHAKDVSKTQTKMKCVGKGDGKEDRFTLEHKSTYKDGSSDANKVEVNAQGVIEGKPISLVFNPEECIIEKAVAMIAISIDKSDNCDAENTNCFQNIGAASDNAFKFGLLAICVILGNIL